MVTVETAALGAGAMVLAGVGEELTHAAAARPWAVRQRVTLTTVETVVVDETPSWVDKWVNFAPLLVGLAALALLYIGHGLPPLTDSTVLFYIAWAWYTTPSLTDVAEAYGERAELRNPDPDAEEKFIIAWKWTSVCVAGLLIMMGADELATLAGLTPRVSAFSVGLYYEAVRSLLYVGGGMMVGSVMMLILDVRD